MLLSTGNLPKKEVLFGLNNDEGTYFLMYGAPGFSHTGQSLITRSEFLTGAGLALTHASDIMKEAAIFHYTDWTDVNSGMANRDALGPLLGDKFFVCPMLDFIQR